MKYYIGVDISKKNLDVDLLNITTQFANQAEEINRFICQVREIISQKKSAIIVCEASGGYEQKLVKACFTANIPIHVAHANKVRAFAKSQGLIAKTDKLDAKVLSDYGRLMQVEPDILLLGKNAEEIKALLKRRNQLIAEKLCEQNRLEIPKNDVIRKSILRHIDWLKKEITCIEKDLKELQQTEEIQFTHNLLTSIPGIGDLVANYLIAFLPELGKLSHKAISALVGVAPFNRDSGKFKGKRFIQGGRAKLRHVLYMSAIASTRWNPELQKFYTRLRNSGKPAKIAIVAVARKLLTMANSVMLRQTPWQDVAPNFI